MAPRSRAEGVADIEEYLMKLRHLCQVTVVVLGLGCAAWPALAAPDAPVPDIIEFNRDVRPVLSDNCFYCHGPDASHRKAGLRLDTPEGLLEDLGGYAAVVPGDPDASEVIRRITAAHRDDLMPPPETDRTLSSRDIAVIRRWIEQGAEYRGHWLYEPLHPPAVPAVEKPGFVVNDIDRFILQTLKAEEVAPSPKADRRTLIRRLSFDLLGLPPTWEQVEAFVNDTRSDAYERLVDELMASPHYGERMAIYWLDLVRFADTVGYHGDRPMNIWPYRDYVIEAFNTNVPFDQFTIEQLAGDLLPEPTLRQRVASGYNRLNMMSEEGGVQDKEYRIRYQKDRARNLGSVWLASTTGCAECHDHKFDPITQKDFYQLGAFFADIKEVGFYGGHNADGNWGEFIRVPTAEQEQQLQDLQAALAAARAELNAPNPETDAAQAEWEKVMRSRAWAPLDLLEARAERETALELQADGSILATGNVPARDTYVLTYRTDQQGINAFRLEVLPHPSLPGRGPGRGSTGNFVLNAFEVFVDDEQVQLIEPTATFSQESWAIAGATDGDNRTGWAIAPKVGQANSAVFQTDQPLGESGTTTLTIRMRQTVGNQHLIGRFRISATSGPRPNKAGDMPDEIAAALAVDPAQRTEEQKEALAAHYRATGAPFQAQRDQIAALEQQVKDLEATIPTTLVTVAAEPRVTRVLARGDWMDESGEIVQPGVFHFMPQIEKDGRATRLDLAHWLMDPQTGGAITARVFTNRLWKLTFGFGLSRNLEDMGSQGEWPTHPELLEWLAGQFIDSGWDIKHLHKLIVMSGTYRQSSHTTPDMRERDPFNTLFARQSRFRLEAEMVRDNALAVSHLLVRDIGGPSAQPYQPPKYYAFLNFPVREYEADTGPNQYRRGVYTWWQRQYLHPMLLAFDASNREECVAQRNRSNIPQQALVLLNDPSFVEASRSLAVRTIRAGETTVKDRLNFIFREVLFRNPTDEEIGVLSDLYAAHASHYRQDPSAAIALLAVGDTPAPADIDPAELAAWMSITRAVMNLYESISRF